ncbi:hypothetical protein [Aquibium microcysteis]|uniref:hypothetical protein n=1 Tax=Aquibium microcysteis TaxID=675281 RepID=UPI00165D01BB|nr:hypothetical protein [Aquibium microcysteis]
MASFLGQVGQVAFQQEIVNHFGSCTPWPTRQNDPAVALGRRDRPLIAGFWRVAQTSPGEIGQDFSGTGTLGVRYALRRFKHVIVDFQCRAHAANLDHLPETINAAAYEAVMPFGVW